MKFFHNLLHNPGLVGTVSLWLGIFALIVACIQFRDTHRQAKLMKSQSSALAFVTESLTTRYIGPFPEYLPQVADLIETARVELRIVVGNPVPAYFSAPNVFMNYSHAIERRVRSGVDVTMTCMDESQRLRRLKLQFPSSQEAWNEWIPKHRGEVETLAKYRFADVDLSVLDHEKFIDLLARVQDDVLREAFKYQGVKVLEVNQMIAVQAWIADRQRAIFAVQTVPARAMSHGLYTSDPQFVEALHSMCDLLESPST